MYNRSCSFAINLEKENILLRIPDDLRTQRHIWDTRRHCHADYELHIIIKGSCRVDVEDRTYQMEERSVILIAPGQYHYPMQTGENFTRLTVAFSPEDGILKQNLQSKIPTCAVFSVSSQICNICNDIFYESAAGNPFRSDLQKALLTQLLVGIFRLLELRERKGESNHDLTEIERITYIDDFFENHFAEPAGEERLAELLGLSKRQLARILQKSYGMGFRQKLICARMDHAAWLLRTSQKPVSQIAEDVGYFSESAFYQVFRRHFHMTPQQYRSKSSGK